MLYTICRMANEATITDVGEGRRLTPSGSPDGELLDHPVISTISGRRSISQLEEPAPDDLQLRALVRAAICAPDHGRLAPWRFIALRKGAHQWFGEVSAAALVERCREEGVEPNEAKVAKERTKLGRAPLVIVVVARRQGDRIPWQEQLAAVAAATQNLLLAAEALGFGTMWRTGPNAYDHRIKGALNLEAEDEIVGFVYVGTVAEGRRVPPPGRCEVDDVLEIVDGGF